MDGEQYLLTCCRYIELNPVRAGMVSHPAEYRWSSWHSHAEGVADGLVRDHPLVVALGDTPRARREAYRALFSDALAEETLVAIRHAANTAWPLGGDCFKQELAMLTARRVVPAPPGRPRVQRPEPQDQGVLPL